LSVTAQELISMINIFLHEMSIIISGYGDYILKYVGDAIIGIFSAGFDSQKPLFFKLPLIEIKIGIDLGDSMIVLYGKKSILLILILSFQYQHCC
jgi:adenylate cyclase